MWAVRDQAEQLVEVTFFDRIKGVTVFAQNFDLTFNQNPFKKEFVTFGAAILFKGDSHS